jgi:hypothetical protein
MATNVTMTIGGVSMSPKKDIEEAIRGASKKYNVPISSLMQEMLLPQLPKIDDFAKAIVKARKEEEAEFARQKQQTGSAIHSINLFDEWRKISHDQQVNEARIANMNKTMTSIEEKINMLMIALGEKPIGTVEMEPLDSPAWANNSNK